MHVVVFVLLCAFSISGGFYLWRVRDADLKVAALPVVGSFVLAAVLFLPELDDENDPGLPACEEDASLFTSTATRRNEIPVNDGREPAERGTPVEGRLGEALKISASGERGWHWVCFNNGEEGYAWGGLLLSGETDTRVLALASGPPYHFDDILTSDDGSELRRDLLDIDRINKFVFETWIDEERVRVLLPSGRRVAVSSNAVCVPRTSEQDPGLGRILNC